MRDTQTNVLLVDDESDMLLSLLRALKAAAPEIAFHAAGNAEQALRLVQQLRPQAAVIDLCLERQAGAESGFLLLERILRAEPTCRVIVLTGQRKMDYGVRALTQGAASFIEKPADAGHLLALLRDGIAQADLRRSYQELRRQDDRLLLADYLVGESPAFARLQQELLYAAGTNQPLLLTGETGTGKGLAARAVHRLSKRGARRFVRWQPNFATADLVNSDLFGHQRGAFTGADQTRSGLIAEADGGTLFLDEVDELPNETQVALLGVLQERKFRPLGSNQELPVDFRLICASNQSIEDCLAKGKLREDFYHRIAHCTVRLPALRERPEDIAPLARFFAARLAQREAVNVLDLDDDALARLRQHGWPGNVRELEAAVEGAAYRAQHRSSAYIQTGDIVLHERRTQLTGGASFDEQVEHFKRQLIDQALAACGGSQAAAARVLKIDRTTLRRIVARRG